MNPDNFEAANLFYTNRPRMNEQIHWVHVDRRPNCVIAVLDFVKVLYFFSWFGCHFKGLFIPVLREIRRSKILPVTSLLTNRTASDISRQSLIFLLDTLILRLNMMENYFLYKMEERSLWPYE